MPENELALSMRSSPVPREHFFLESEEAFVNDRRARDVRRRYRREKSFSATRGVATNVRTRTCELVYRTSAGAERDGVSGKVSEERRVFQSLFRLCKFTSS